MSNTSLDPEKVALEAPAAPDADEPVLAMPEGWMIDDLARERLARQLAHAPSRVCGVVAETSALPPGSSYRVHAERLCLRPFSAVSETSHDTLTGAVLLRPGIAFATRDGVVETERGPFLVDSGAHVHDPWRAIAPPQPASELGRPPFPRRPIVVFLACEPDVEVLDWARSIVNNLVRRDVEGRLALLDIAEGLHLTQPCLPTEESIRALSPDVIVALDQAALDQLPAWCGTNRSTVAVTFTPDVAATVELVSWQLERAQGRVRARIGRQINAPSLVSLVNRLCSGPHPAPPVDTAVPTAAVTTLRALLSRRSPPTSKPATRRSVMVLTRVGDRPGDHVLEGLVDHLVSAGHAGHVDPFERSNASAARQADVVVIRSATDGADLPELIEVRRRARRPTISHIEPSDAFTDASSPDQTLHLAAPPVRLATSCGNATTASTAVYGLLRSLGLRAHLLPPLLTREFAAELRSARGERNLGSDAVIGWHVGSAGTPTPDYVDTVTDAVLEVLAERPNLSVEAVGEASRVPAQLLAHPRVSVRAAQTGAEALSRWTVHVWSPSLVNGGIADEPRPFIEASAAGVPTVLPEPIEAAIGEYPLPGRFVQSLHGADGWSLTLRSLLDDEETWSGQSREAARWFDAMHGPAASDVAVNRFLGWALSTEEHP
jgi:hypothetical protein